MMKLDPNNAIAFIFSLILSGKSNKYFCWKVIHFIHREYKKVNATYCDNLAEVLCVNQGRIDFTDKPITAWGGMGVLGG